MKGIMKGKTMMVGFYARGPVGAQASTPAIEISSSTYVLHSAELLYRNCYDEFDGEAERRGIFFTNVHSEGPNRPEDVPNARIFMDRSWLTTFSTFCTYAGNTLLMKKGNHRFSVDYATYYGEDKELSEHMFITGLKGPGGRVTYFAGAAPSGCGKTTTAMVGTDFVGDDLAQIWIAADGTCRAVNPEAGIFGIVEDVNREGDPYLMKALRDDDTEAIWSNVLIDEDGVPYWTGCGEDDAQEGRQLPGRVVRGQDRRRRQADPAEPQELALHGGRQGHRQPQRRGQRRPGGRAHQGHHLLGSRRRHHAAGVGGQEPRRGRGHRREHRLGGHGHRGGATGVKRQPWANAPFIPGALADYMNVQFKFFNSRPQRGRRPIMAGLNYFLTHANRGSDGRACWARRRT